MFGKGQSFYPPVGQPQEGPVETPLVRFETRVGEDGQVEVKV